MRLKTIFITGAGSGIGLATARLFAEEGWFVGCFDINADALKKLEAEIGGERAMFGTLDVTDTEAVTQSLRHFSAETEGRLDLLFNNAGIDVKGPFADTPWDKITSIVNVNFVAAMHLIHAAIPLLKATENSLCLSTASASAIFGAANMAVYSATKHAMKGLTEALSVELAQFDVRVADVLPGIIDTGMLPRDVKAQLPKEGPWRVLPSKTVAEQVLHAYTDNKLHYYVPTELAEYDIKITTKPEVARDRIITGGLFS